MKTLKLTPVQQFRLKEAHRHSAQVLDETKRSMLEGDALRDMRQLESVVQNLEYFAIFRREAQ